MNDSQLVLVLVMTVAAFALSAMPFAVWLARLRGKDVRAVGDGNPGATNAMRASGRLVGLAALLLDVSKAALPVGLAYVQLDIRGIGMWLIATAAVAGHAWSPFLGGRGGKALATILGVWIGLTLWEMPLVLLTMVITLTLLLNLSGWAVLGSMSVGMAYLLVFHPDPLLMVVLATQILLVLWKYRADLLQRPALKPALTRRLRAR